jgi:hypothetical protein
MEGVGIVTMQVHHMVDAPEPGLDGGQTATPSMAKMNISVRFASIIWRPSLNF